MTPCAKGDEAETEEIFLPTKKREKSIARKIKEIVTVLKEKRKRKEKQNRGNKRQKSDMKKNILFANIIMSKM